jgi:hypothetical protein
MCYILCMCVCGHVRYDNCICNVFARFLLFLSDLLKIILVLGIRVLVSTEYLKTLYILYSEW